MVAVSRELIKHSCNNRIIEMITEIRGCQGLGMVAARSGYDCQGDRREIFVVLLT